jgi:F-type H+-transporting ATPase subunit epsilon
MAEQKQLQINIAKVDGSVFAGDVLFVTVPGTEGEMTILANHSPLMTVLKAGVVTIKLPDDTVKKFDIESGTMEVSNNQVTILL